MHTKLTLIIGCAFMVAQVVRAQKSNSGSAATTGKADPQGDRFLLRVPSPDVPAHRANGVLPPSNLRITSQGQAYFDCDLWTGIFADDVDVKHPNFHLTSDLLEVYLEKISGKGLAAAPANVTTGTEGSPISRTQTIPTGTTLKQAIAKGRLVLIEKMDEHGEPQLAICRHATYVGSTGDIFLRDQPQVQRGRNLIRAASPTTYMILTQNGKLRTYGPSITEIVQEGEGLKH